MQLNHVANRLNPRHFETVVAMLKTRLGFLELRRTERSIWLRQPGANVDLQFSRSETPGDAADKRRSQVSFLSERPRAALEELAAWAMAQGLDATVGSYSDREFYLDCPAAFVDFVIEAMTPELADYPVAEPAPRLPVVPIAGLFETHLTVADLDRSIAFYRDVLGLELAHRIPARGVAFFWIGGPGAAMLGLWSIGASPMALRLHTAFRVALPQVEAAVPALRAAGLAPRDGGRGAMIEEPVVLAWMPAASVYFDDPDGHSLEYICMLPDPPRPDLDRIPLSAWRAMQGRG